MAHARILFCGGGTGGHLMPAVTLARAAELEWPGLATRFLVAGREAEHGFFADRRDRVVELFSGEAARPSLLRVDRYVRAYRRARGELRRFDPDLIVLLGGYVALAGFAAPRALPSILMESNVCPGRTARLLARRASAVLLEWEAAARSLGGARCHVSGMPQPPELFRRDPRADRVRLGLDPDVPVLLWFGGSQGALGLNRLAFAVLPELARRLPALQVVIGAGRHAAALAALDLPHGVRVRVERFLWPMAPYYGAADAVVGRAGGMTVAELCAAGRASVLVPYPHHGDQHQRRNALGLVDRGAALMVEEGPRAPGELADHLARLLGDERERSEVARCAASLAKPDALREALSLLEQSIVHASPGGRPRTSGNAVFASGPAP